MTPVPLHLGSLHVVELVLFVALAVGPFLGLGVVIAVTRRRDRHHLKHLNHLNEGERPC